MNNNFKYEVKRTGIYKKDYKAAIKRGYDISLLNDAVSMLAETGTLPEKYNDHKLIGNWAGYRECHITNDWLLIYKINESELILTLTRTGTHSDLLDN